MSRSDKRGPSPAEERAPQCETFMSSREILQISRKYSATINRAVPRRVILSASRNFATMRFRHLRCRPYGFDRLRMTHCRKIAIGGISSEQRLTPSVSVYKCMPKVHVSIGPFPLSHFPFP